ncbi:hypothetical protein P691DRAFT_770724 [Macrolepiota fuliginosa MF-IS2]|uniref:Uncharacterized protein n=1 Tax=Macrolepiota fuliginosa MF-IS2 TaxID=1400762 RepID=A0A9P5XPD8_9AGAR|nr:hypothetical protein P691DRAFT_770724 [Macrolepiota fuliginosa MF-IS2]
MPPKDSRGSNEQQRLGSVKATYLDRSKKNSREAPADNVAGPSKPRATTARKLPSPAKITSDAVFKAPENPIRIVDFRTETSPTRMHADASVDGSEKPGTTTKKQTHRHNRSSSSVITVENTNGDNKPVSSGPSPRVKPPSVVSRMSQSENRSHTPASETNHDNASVTDSIADTNSISANRIKRTENERKQYFENESECGSVEPRRAFCTRCKDWVRLSSRQTYYVRPWEMHRAKCDQKLPVENTYKDLGIVATIPFVVPRNEKTRKVLLELDDTAEIVTPSQIKCKTCEQWVPLEKRYSIKCWTRHEGACHNNLRPTDIEKTLERKLFFMCDGQFKSFRNKHTVECAACNKDIALNPDSEYDLDCWLDHKETCQITPETHSRVSPSAGPQAEVQPKSNATPTSAANPAKPEPPVTQTQPSSTTPPLESEPEKRPTMSTTDSELTLVPSSSASTLPPSMSAPSASASTSASSPRATVSTSAASSRKRKRDSLDEETDVPVEGQGQSTEDIDMDGERPAIRPRTESYVPVDRDAPSGLGWFLLPFKAFVKGFKESLTTLDS